MKKLFKILYAFLALSLVISLGTVGVGAALAPAPRGDATLDNKLDITDATAIQKHLCGLETLSKLASGLSDIDVDGQLTVKDATFIQKVLASLIDYDFYENCVALDIYLQGLYMDYDSGKAMAGEPVTFRLKGNAATGGFTATFKVNDEVIFTGSEDTSWQYTFKEPGVYEIRVTIESQFGMTAGYFAYYEVVEPYPVNDLTITALLLDEFYPGSAYNYGIVASVKGGEAPYEYSFVMTSHEGSLLHKQDWSEDNVFHISNRNGFLTGIDTADVSVSVKDKNGAVVTETRSFSINDCQPPA